MNDPTPPPRPRPGPRGRLDRLVAALGTVLSVGLGLAVPAAWGFVELTDEVTEGTLQATDEAVLLWIDGVAGPGLDAVALEVTALGNTATLTLVVLLCTAFLVRAGRRGAAGLLWAAAAGSALLNPLLKELVGRPRPSVVEWGTQVHSLSFPSGHAMNGLVVYSLVAYLLATTPGAPAGTDAATRPPGTAFRVAVLSLATLLIVSIGLSRMALGVHYPSDVLGGFAAGFVWAVASATAVRMVERPGARGEYTPG